MSLTPCSLSAGSKATETRLNGTDTVRGGGVMTRRATHVVFGRIAPLLHVHDFHVQHSPELHLDPAKALHRSDRQAAAAPGKRSRITGERSRHSSLSGGRLSEQLARLTRAVNVIRNPAR